MSKKVLKTLLDVDGQQIPAKIYQERRRNVRANIGKNGAILRLPYGLTPQEEKDYLNWFKEYIKEQLDTHQEIREQFLGKGYKDGDVLEVGSRKYLLRIRFTDRKTHGAKIANATIYLELARKDIESHRQKAIRHLLSRTVGSDFLPEITRRVLELNQLYFQMPIKSVNLKYNSSNWGSCSSNSNLNLSTRLLFAPQAVIDYVIIHELAHLIELNHSPRFWKLVADAMPDYQRKEEWLKEHGSRCNF